MRRQRREEFSRLVGEHRVALVVLARRLVGEAEAEDVVQGALAAAWSRFQSGTEIRDPRAWIMRFVINVARNVLQSRRRRPPTRADVYDVDPSGVEGALASLEREVEHAAFGRDPRGLLEHVGDGLKEALMSLSERERMTFILRAVGEFDYQTLARVFDVPKGTVMSRLFRAREKLRIQLQRRAHRPFEHEEPKEAGSQE